MRSQHAGTVGPGTEAFAHDPRPDATGCSNLRDLLEEVVVDVEEERQSRPERIRIEASLDAGLYVRNAIGQSERELLNGRRSGLPDVVPRN